MQVTQKQIAERAGVSSSVVSRILSDKVMHITLSEETLIRVKRIAAEMGYFHADKSRKTIR